MNTMPAKASQNIATLEGWMNGDNLRRKFNEVLDKGAGAFATSLLSLAKQTPQLAACDPKTTLAAAMTAATLKLPINPNLGFAYIIPYGNQAQFQMGYKGFIQLAMRSGQYRTINAATVYEGQVEDVDFITGEIVKGKKKSDRVIGYVAYFELLNGFSKTLYMPKEDMERHASEFSKSFAYDKRSGKSSSVWSSNFNAMALKTVLKLLISKYGIMSVDMQGEAMATAIERDQAVIGKGGSTSYVDNDRNWQPPVDVEAEPAHQEAPTPFDAPAKPAASEAAAPTADAVPNF